MSLEERFWSKVNVVAPDECWLWTGAMCKNGYGYIRDGQKVRQSHKVSYELNHGQVPKGQVVCHTCDVGRCVNPKHLWAGTYKDNMYDAINKGRASVGEKHPISKLTEIDVWYVRFFLGKLSQVSIAKLFGVSRGCIGHIVSGKNWNHTKELP